MTVVKCNPGSVKINPRAHCDVICKMLAFLVEADDLHVSRGNKIVISKTPVTENFQMSDLTGFDRPVELMGFMLSSKLSF